MIAVLAYLIGANKAIANEISVGSDKVPGRHGPINQERHSMMQLIFEQALIAASRISWAWGR